ncbi:hypothetical protein E2C01_075420 [Portunus trituberculatus]|uniref:Uncharacterized protein n=1 Tax=Portunus trituberculatus TaxID=210409 RepID=A0A5B7IH07_PORTR|nr:hypothetical protein [Portunus trituberculatus]
MEPLRASTITYVVVPSPHACPPVAAACWCRAVKLPLIFLTEPPPDNNSFFPALFPRQTCPPRYQHLPHLSYTLSSGLPLLPPLPSP